MIGPNGAGKTTMMDVITGKTRPDSGTAFFGQTIDLTDLTEPEIADRGIGRKFQKPTVFEQHSVFENLELARKADKRVWPTLTAQLDSTARDRILTILETIKLAPEASRLAGLLSHGQKQWLEIGMLLMQEPQLLLLDEPVAGMTDDETMRSAELFLTARRRLHAGRRRARHGLRREDRRPRHRAARGPRAGRRLDAARAGERAGHRSVPGTDDETPTLASLAFVFAAPEGAQSVPWGGPAGLTMLIVDKLNQYYGGSHILRNVSFDVPAGKCTTLLGRNGVGKTTLLRCLMGMVPVRSGDIRFDAATITSLPPYARASLGLGYVPQGRDIFPRLTVLENLQMGLATQKQGAGIPRFIYEMFPVLKDMLNRRGGDLSGGQQQQLAIGRALALRPKLLILDEPTEGIQPSIIKDIERAIRKLTQGGEMAILLVEQYYDFAKSLADHYVVMSRGEVVARGAGATMDDDNVRALLAV